MKGKTINIGRAVDNARLYVLDKHFNPVPIGTPGQLFIGGVGVARGYLNREELTKERFIDNPFATPLDIEKGYTRLYQTGDIVSWLPNGELKYIGRNDEQVKIRGYRIELGEIESALLECNEIKQAIIEVQQHNSTDFLVAYLLVDEEQKLDISVLKTELSEQLPEYMIPQYFHQLTEIPLTLNKKIDHRKLPKIEVASSTTFVAAQSKVERQISAVLENMLALDKISLYDNFFDIGVNSILVTRFCAELNKQLETSSNIADIFTYNTIEKLAGHIEKVSLKSHSELDAILRPLTEIKPNLNHLFFIHPGRAGCEAYQELAQACEVDFNCYGFNNYNITSENKIACLETLAKLYLDQLMLLPDDVINQQRKVCLCGWSLGGNIALEMAAQLEVLGFNNIHVILLDTLVKTEKLRIIADEIEYEEALKMQKQLLDDGFDQSYIKQLYLAGQHENQLDKCQLSSPLSATDVTLLKAGSIDDELPEGIKANWRKLIAEAKDNNIARYVQKPIETILVDQCHHGNILQEIPLIKSHFYK